MKLTGKAKEQFSDWLHTYMMTTEGGTNFRFFDSFKYLPKSMQWGIYQDWADWIDCEMWVEKTMDELRYWYNIYEDDGTVHYNEGFKTRQEARDAAIEKLNEIVNEK